MGGGGDAIPGGISGLQGDPSARILHRVIQSTIARRTTKNSFLDPSDLEKSSKCFHVITFTIRSRLSTIITALIHL